MHPIIYLRPFFNGQFFLSFLFCFCHKTLAHPSECWRQRTLNSVNGHTAARMQFNGNLAVKISQISTEWKECSLSAPSLDCVFKAEASSWSCSINPNRTGSLSLLLPWTVSARQASLPGQLVYPFAGPFLYSCFSVKPSSQVLLGPY